MTVSRPLEYVEITPEILDEIVAFEDSFIVPAHNQSLLDPIFAEVMPYFDRTGVGAYLHMLNHVYREIAWKNTSTGTLAWRHLIRSKRLPVPYPVFRKFDASIDNTLPNKEG